MFLYCAKTYLFGKMVEWQHDASVVQHDAILDIANLYLYGVKTCLFSKNDEMTAWCRYDATWCYCNIANMLIYGVKIYFDCWLICVNICLFWNMVE